MGILEALIPAAADIDTIQEEGYSPLLVAASVGKRAWVERLIQAGADPGRRTKDGKGLAISCRQAEKLIYPDVIGS